MLNVSKSELRLTSQGYHVDSYGKKFVRIFTSLDRVKVQVKIQKGKEMHIKSISTDFPYVITDNWVEISFTYLTVAHEHNPWLWVKDYIDERLKEIWFV